MTRTAIIIPCYNEAERLDVDRVLAFARACPHIRLLFVDDGSRDNTGALLRKLEQAAPDRIGVLEMPQNGGKAEAVRCGMLAVAETSQAPVYAGYWDADLATPLEAIPEFEQVLEADQQLSLVMGSRIPLLGRRIERTRARRMLGRLFASVASVVLGLDIYDTQCGAKLFRLSPSVRATFSQPFLSKWIFDVEILARLTQLGRAGWLPPVESAVAELPLRQWIDIDGSKLRPRDFAKAVLELSRILQIYRLSSRPLDWIPEEIASELIATETTPVRAYSPDDPQAPPAAAPSRRRAA